jgi:hypothetical protein
MTERPHSNTPVPGRRSEPDKVDFLCCARYPTSDPRQGGSADNDERNITPPRPGSSPAVVVPLAPIETSAVEDLDTKVYHARERSGRPAHRAPLVEHLNTQTLRRSGRPLVTPERLHRFDECGSGIFVLQHRHEARYRLKGNFCRDRWCGACQARRRRQVAYGLERAIASAVAEDPAALPRKMLLTLRSSEDTLDESIRRIQRCFRALTKTDLWAKSVRGYIWTIETKRQDHSGLWYVHIHAVVLTPWLSSNKLSEAWYGITGDSYIATCSSIDGRTDREGMDAEELTQERLLKAVGYVAKYITKPANLANMALPYAVEAIAALDGKRLWTCGGTLKQWHRLIRDEAADQWCADDWVPVATLRHIATKALHGDEIARRILASLRLWPQGKTDEPQPATPMVRPRFRVPRPFESTYDSS